MDGKRRPNVHKKDFDEEESDFEEETEFKKKPSFEKKEPKPEESEEKPFWETEDSGEEKEEEPEEEPEEDDWESDKEKPKKKEKPEEDDWKSDEEEPAKKEEESEEDDWETGDSEEKEEPEEDDWKSEEGTIKKEEKPLKEAKQKKDSFKVSNSSVWQIVTAVLAILLVVSIFTHGFIFGEKPTAAVVVEPKEEPTPTPKPTEVQRVNVSVGDDPQKGPDDSKVTIIEFSDYQCPFCARAEETMKQISKTYGDDVRLVFKDFPLGFHQNAQKAAEAAECAREQGKFWEYHDKLFANQEALERDNLKAYAAELNLDIANFNKCLDTGKYEAEVKEDVEEGKQAGVKGTPAFFINGRLITGAQPFSSFKQIIDEELKK